MNQTLPARGLALRDVLTAFQEGKISRAELLEHISSQLYAGATVGELEAILSTREFEDGLPRHLHRAILELLDEHITAPPVQAIASEAAEAEDDLTVPLEEIGDDAGPAAPVDVAGRPALQVGDVLGGRYVVVALLGKGGMSRVYKAVDPRRASPEQEGYVAVKTPLGHFDDTPESFALMLERIQRLHDLAHPNIARVYDCERDGSMTYITMEYLSGAPLSSTLRTRSLSREESLAILKAVADALSYAHGLQVVHGDLKPGNVIVTASNAAKLIDFDLAKWIIRTSTREDTPVATPRYASPQLMARHRPQTSDDVYALACLAYELLAGTPAFADGHNAQLNRSPPPRRPGISPSQYTAILNGLHASPAKRTSTVTAFMGELTDVGRARSKRIVAWAGIAMVLLIAGWFALRATRNRAEPAVPTEPEVSAVSVSPAAVATIAAVKAGTVLRDCETCPSMTVISAGRFVQGAANGDKDASAFEKPAHEVTFAQGFALSTNDITVREFRDFLAVSKRRVEGCEIYGGRWRNDPHANWSAPGFEQSERAPVVCVSWNDATAYAAWLAAKTGHRYRLPSASEWEYAARAGSDGIRPWGGNPAGACSHANVADQSAAGKYPGWSAFPCDDKFVNTSPVGSFAANAFGLNDMLGNVFQWTDDCWSQDYAQAPADGSAATQGDCRERELRGGSWFTQPGYVKTSFRSHFAADTRTSTVGFRLVRETTP